MNTTTLGDYFYRLQFLAEHKWTIDAEGRIRTGWLRKRSPLQMMISIDISEHDRMRIRDAEDGDANLKVRHIRARILEGLGLGEVAAYKGATEKLAEPDMRTVGER